ncbi:MAG: HAD-IA family hydrolase [Reyranella sp.]|uniref:HAD-IA family hydrolase n=1 Tax=Reyranella sp. TaxID=1929291 RepID=UPI00273216E0|nr:HAD-IA family hydrolase [Reyranella sp.]MDP1961181.1 HAD-IA family hydrolase [Reyranella sp.]
METAMHPNADNLLASRFDTVIYDLDGTLIDSARDMCVAVSRVLADHGLPPITDQDARIFMGQGSKITMGKAFAKNGRTLDDIALSAATREFVRYYEADPVSNTVAFDGVAEVVARFSRLGLRQGVCTNKFERPARIILEHLKLMPPITDVAGADTFPVRKPDPRHILMLLERMGGTPERAVMIGDSIHDAEAAHRAGIPAILVSWGYTARPARELGADDVIDRFDALPDALNRLAAR